MLNLPISIDLGLGPALNNLILLMSIMLFTAVLTVGIIAVIYISLFRIKCTVLPVVGSGIENQLGIGKKKWNRFKWNKSKTAWIALKPLFGRKEIEPFAVDYIYAGNHTFALELPDKKYIPLKINLNPLVDGKRSSLKSLIAEALPVPYYLSKWNEIELQQEEIEFQEKGFWAENKHIVIAMITIALCLLLVALTIYFTFKYAGGKFDVINKGFQDIVSQMKIGQTIPSK